MYFAINVMIEGECIDLYIMTSANARMNTSRIHLRGDNVPIGK